METVQVSCSSALYSDDILYYYSYSETLRTLHDFLLLFTGASCYTLAAEVKVSENRLFTLCQLKNSRMKRVSDGRRRLRAEGLRSPPLSACWEQSEVPPSLRGH